MKKFILSIVIALNIFVAAIVLTPTPDGFPILEYHTVTDHPDPDAVRYNVKPDDLAAQLDYLIENGYTTITMLDFIEAKNARLTLPPKPVMLTFDDGYEDNYTNLLPLLEARNMKAVVYVVANQIGHDGYLSFDQLKDMQTRGIEIENHTADHLPLDELTHDEIVYEVRDSKIYLEWSGLNTVYSLSYPNGAYNDEIVDILRQENYFTAVTGDPGLNNFSTDQLKMCRVNIPQPRLGLFEFRLRLLKADVFARIRALKYRLSVLFAS